MSEKPQNLPNVEERVETNKPVDNPFSQENMAKKYANKDVASMTKDAIKSPELKTFTEKKDAELKDILEGKEKSPEDEKNKNEIVDKVLKEKLGDKYEQYINTGYTKEVLREKYLESNRQKLDIKLTDKEGITLKDKNGKEITNYQSILEKNKGLASLNTTANPEFTKELLTVYGIDEIEGYAGLIESLGRRGEKLPTKLEDFDSFINEKMHNIVSYNDSSKEDIGKDIQNYKKIIDSNPGNMEAKGILGFLERIFNISGSANEFYKGNLGKIPVDLEKLPPSIRKVIEVGMSQMGVNEKDGSADKYLQEIGHEGRKSAGDENAWCAAFVNWTLKNSGMDYNSSLASQSFINGSGKGHVGFKIGNQLLGGNQSDQVSLKPLNLNKVQGWVMPDNRGKIHRRGESGFDQNNIPDGAILVFSSSKSTR